MKSLCLGCGSVLPEPFIDLGLTPLANALVRPEQAGAQEEKYPLAVSYCSSCYLVQLTHRIPPTTLFDSYLYFSSYSESYLRHAAAFASEVIKRRELTAKSRVLEIASNDGYLLQYFQSAGMIVQGIEPAANIAAVAQAKGIPTRNQYFGLETVHGITQAFGLTDVLIGNNVLAHVPQINDFLRAARLSLAPDGLAIFEVPDLAMLLSKTEFDTIYHEHVFYYSLSALDVLAERNGLAVTDVKVQDVHGGSLRVFLERKDRDVHVQEPVAQRLAQEREWGLRSPEAYAGFAARVENIRRSFVDLVRVLKHDGRSVACYGAPAKGNTLLNYCGIDAGDVDFAVDRNPHKQGLLLPGSHIPILPPQELLDRQPDYAILLPWNLASEIVGQQQEYLRRGGKFIVPIPEQAVIGWDAQDGPVEVPSELMSSAKSGPRAVLTGVA